ncbi:hypothetical protein C7S17_1786 [Burkholderia thailandensis]|nr:hypothetical protein [Burkholderia thailandensis]
MPAAARMPSAAIRIRPPVAATPIAAAEQDFQITSPAFSF